MARGCLQVKKKQIIYTVVSRREVAILEDYISNIDPDAFITIMDTKEILGKGFQNLNMKLESYDNPKHFKRIA